MCRRICQVPIKRTCVYGSGVESVLSGKLNHWSRSRHIGQVASKTGSARESVKPRDSSGSAALAFIVLAATVAGGMWKPAFCAGFQALWESGESPTFDFSTISTTRHFHSEAGKQPNQALCAHRHAGGTVRG